MDLVHKRYASPCFFMDGMIQMGRFDEFVFKLVKTINEEKEEKLDWEFWLHKVWEGTFREFKENIEINKKDQNMPKKTIEETVNSSLFILKNFTPQEGVNKA